MVKRTVTMLNIKLAPEDSQSMAQDGFSILRSLQNKSLPMVDLLVRESIQIAWTQQLPDKTLGIH